MWGWDQGRLGYFQFDVIRALACFVVEFDFRAVDGSFIRGRTGLPFSPNRVDYHPWRNYSRTLKQSLIISESFEQAVPTEVALLLSDPEGATCDEYLHFLAQATSDPSPALQGWKQRNKEQPLRYPLCFALRYLMAKTTALDEYQTSLDEIVKAYSYSRFIGDETDLQYLELLSQRRVFLASSLDGDTRQARESLKVLSQISYLHCTGGTIIVSLGKADAHEIFEAIKPVAGNPETEASAEIIRLAKLFKGGSTHDFFDYENSILSDVVQSGFVEGTRLKKTHTVIERNSRLRQFYFDKCPTTVCDTCKTDTRKKYPWTERVLDIHHILPLASGTRVDSKRGTVLEDLSPICPSCHRAVHRFYDRYLNRTGKKDFDNPAEAKNIFEEAKQSVVVEAANV